MAITELSPYAAKGTPVAVIAATATATATPDANSDRFSSQFYGRIRTLITYAGAVTACTLRLWIRDPASGTWYRGASTADTAPLTPASGNQSRDWTVGKGVEFTFQVESISPGTAGNTVAVAVVGVQE